MRLAVETADPREAGVREALEEVQAACRELARLTTLDEVANQALEIALTLTRSSVAFLGLTDETGDYERVFSRYADAAQKGSPGETERLIASASQAEHASICGEALTAGGETIGMIGVARDSSYPDVQRHVLAILANQVASSVQIATLRGRRQEMVDTLVNLRAEMERSEKE